MRRLSVAQIFVSKRANITCAWKNMHVIRARSFRANTGKRLGATDAAQPVHLHQPYSEP